MALTKKRRDEFAELLEAHLLEHGPRVEELLAESRARNQAEQWKIEQQARLAREREWYGEPEPEPVDERPRVVATRSFEHRGNQVPIGSIWLKSHDVVQSAPDGFADVQN